MSDPKVKRWVGKYEVGKTIVQGTFAKLRSAKDTETGESVALKILDKDKLLKTNMSEQVKNSLFLIRIRFYFLCCHYYFWTKTCSIKEWGSHVDLSSIYKSDVPILCFAFADKDRNLHNDADKSSKCSAAVWGSSQCPKFSLRLSLFLNKSKQICLKSWDHSRCWRASRRYILS